MDAFTKTYLGYALLAIGIAVGSWYPSFETLLGGIIDLVFASFFIVGGATALALKEVKVDAATD